VGLQLSLSTELSLLTTSLAAITTPSRAGRLQREYHAFSVVNSKLRCCHFYRLLLELVKKFPKFIPHTIDFVSAVQKQWPERYVTRCNGLKT
jgi:hypothetical protein